MFIFSVTPPELLFEALGPLFEIEGESSIHYGSQTGMKFQRKNEQVVAELSMMNVPLCNLNTDEEDGVAYLDLDQLWLVLKSFKYGELKLIFQDDNKTLKFQHETKKADDGGSIVYEHLMMLDAVHDKKDISYTCPAVEANVVMLSEDFRMMIHRLVDIEQFADVMLTKDRVKLSSFTDKRIFKSKVTEDSPLTEGTCSITDLVSPTKFRIYEEDSHSIIKASERSSTVEFLVPVSNKQVSCMLHFRDEGGALYLYYMLLP